MSEPKFLTMPWRYHIDKELRVIFSEGYDVVTEADMADHRRDLLADPDFDPTYRQLVDFSRITRFEVSPKVMRDLALQRVFSPASKRAFVAPSDEVFGSARMFEAWHQRVSSEFMVFRDLAEARRWLGLDG